MRAEAEARAWEEHDCKLREEAQHIVEEKLARVARWDKWLEEKLMEVLEGQLTQVVLEVDSEVEEMREAEGSEAIRTEDFGMTGGTQSLVMEVDKEEEDEVVVVEEVKRGEMRKWVPLLLPKTSRKRVQVGTAMQTLAGSQAQESLVQGSQAGLGNAGSTGKPCWRCIKHWVQCIVATDGARCENCQAIHYRCLLMLPKESGGGRGGALGSQRAKVAEGEPDEGAGTEGPKNHYAG